MYFKLIFKTFMILSKERRDPNAKTRLTKLGEPILNFGDITTTIWVFAKSLTYRSPSLTFGSTPENDFPDVLGHSKSYGTKMWYLILEPNFMEPK